jgi:hydroxymethylbilane synthase
LALWQANYIRDALIAGDPQLQIELKVIKTKGDQALAEPLYGTLDKGLFTTEIEAELLAGSIAMAVHSLKDLPTELPAALCVAAITSRADPADALISKAGPLDALPAGATVLTGSLRRQGQLLSRRPDLKVAPVRGNVQTRLRKLDESDAAATILAAAGLTRAALADRITERFDPTDFLPACGQGALAIEICRDDERTRGILAPLEHAPTRWAVTAERAFLADLGGGCLVPVGAYARFDDGNTLTLTGMVCDLTGEDLLRDTVAGRADGVDDAEALGRSLGARLRELGCAAILAKVAQQNPLATERNA